MIGWHFTAATLRDGRPLPAIGEWLEHIGPISLCSSGLHASLTPWEAFAYAPGTLLHHVEVEGDIFTGLDKFAGRRRRILASRDVTPLLRRFACDQALAVIHLWEPPDIVRRYLESCDEKLRSAAWDAAWGATDSAAAAKAASAAAYAASAAKAAAAANSAAAANAAAAAWDATWDVTQDAAGAAARAAWDAAQDAAQDAAWDAAQDAAWDAAAAHFDLMMYEFFERAEDAAE